MPTNIKKWPRAEIKEEFEFQWRKMSAKGVKELSTEFKRATRKQRKQELAVHLARLASIARGNKEAGSLFDRAKLQLRRTHFEAFSFLSEARVRDSEDPDVIDDLQWVFVGYTDTIIMEVVSYADWYTPWPFDIGRYTIMVPRRSFERQDLTKIHMLPRGNEDVYERHPHHVAGNTCWEDFGPLVQSALGLYDVVEVFRLLYTFLSRFNQRSPLVEPPPWSITIKDKA